MLPSFAILLPLAAILPLTLTAPSPKGGRVGGGGGSLGGGGGGGGGGGLALAGLAGVVVANAQNGYSLDGNGPPNSGYDATSTCTYTGGNATTDPTWISSMTGCLNALAAPNFNGNACTPPVGGQTFGFWKGNNDYGDGAECYQRCVGCLSTAISAGQAVTTKCQYEYRTHELVGIYKTHTCTMGYDAPK